MVGIETAIRIATSADLRALHPVIERAYRGDAARAGWTHEADLLEGERTDVATLQAIIDDAAQRLLIATQGDRVIGCVSIADRGNGLAYLGLLCVDPLLQAEGFGRTILASAEAAALAEFGADRIEMTVIESRHELIAYYERRGYRQTSERRDFPIQLDPPIFMTVLEKQIA